MDPHRLPPGRREYVCSICKKHVRGDEQQKHRTVWNGKCKDASFILAGADGTTTVSPVKTNLDLVRETFEKGFDVTTAPDHRKNELVSVMSRAIAELRTATPAPAQVQDTLKAFSDARELTPAEGEAPFDRPLHLVSHGGVLDTSFMLDYPFRYHEDPRVCSKMHAKLQQAGGLEVVLEMDKLVQDPQRALGIPAKLFTAMRVTFAPYRLVAVHGHSVRFMCIKLPPGMSTGGWDDEAEETLRVLGGGEIVWHTMPAKEFALFQLPLLIEYLLDMLDEAALDAPETPGARATTKAFRGKTYALEKPDEDNHVLVANACSLSSAVKMWVEKSPRCAYTGPRSPWADVKIMLATLSAAINALPPIQ